MPGVDLPDLSSSPPLRLLLKSHKTLPRKRDIGIEAIHFFSSQVVKASGGTVITTAPALPLTPPVIVQEENSPSEAGLQEDGPLKSDRATPPRVPPMWSPEVTPPQNTSPDRLNASQAGQPLSSSRTESFRTAFETIPSDEDTDNCHSSTRSLQQSKWPKVQRNERPIDPNSPFSQPTILDSLDWERMNVRKRGYHTEQTVVRSTKSWSPSNDYPQNEIPAIDARDNDFRDRVRDAKTAAASASVEQFGEDIGWPTDDSSIPTEDPHSSRISGVSATSVVEAVIIDSPPRAKRALRHTEKRQSLRSASSPITESERNLFDSHSHHRLVHKAARITEQDRKSVASDASVSVGSTLGPMHSNVDVVPVVVIPERRSSLKGSSDNSRNQSRACSRRSSQRTTATPGSRISPLDRPHQRNRTLSDSTPRPFSGTDSRGRTFSQPVIPPRSSSLSAPTSRNCSQTTSLTSESLRRHAFATDQKQAEPELPEVQVDASGLHNHGDTPTGIPIIADEGTSDLAPPSLPFAESSIHSLSPGPVEISEATTVSLFPHNNNSLVVVDQRVLPESGAVQAVRAKYRGQLDPPHTPDAPTQALHADFDSPLRNPRPPPKPRVGKALPPTPAEGLNGQAGSPHNAQAPPGGLVRRFGSMRRSLSARPHSGSLNSAWRSSTMSVKNPRAGKNIESSFWWPRRFWDDTGNGESPQKETGTRNLERNQIISNSLGMPQDRVVFEGPRLDRRSPEMRRLVGGMRHPASPSNLASNRVLSPDILRTRSPLYQRRFSLMAMLRLKLRPMRLRNLRKHMRRSAQRREEKEREATREALKRSIGDVVHVGSST